MNTLSENIALYIHRGKNYLRIFSLALLITICIFSIVSFFFYGFIFAPVLLAALFGIFCIRFPKLYIYSDRIVIVKVGILEKFNDFNSYKYKEIESIRFSKGFTNWGYLIISMLLGSKHFSGNSKADQMIVKTKSGETAIFNRFGTRSKFIDAIKMVNSQLH